eukprot:GHVS01038158.1.p1 GENE.GHVS01038158.1~~GHVS01038158.1.p1  ORF type:complete len:190 (+),score=30.66 GHVS01038158.1:238-807(+)
MENILLQLCKDMQRQNVISRKDLEDRWKCVGDNPSALSIDDFSLEGRSALHWAVSTEQRVVVHFLLEKYDDLNINTQDDEGWSPLHSASSAGQPQIVALLLQRKTKLDEASTASGATPLHYAAAKGHIDVVKLLCTEGANLNARDKYGNTPLTKAAAAGGGDPNRRQRPTHGHERRTRGCVSAVGQSVS